MRNQILVFVFKDLWRSHNKSSCFLSQFWDWKFPTYYTLMMNDVVQLVKYVSENVCIYHLGRILSQTTDLYIFTYLIPFCKYVTFPKSLENVAIIGDPLREWKVLFVFCKYDWEFLNRFSFVFFLTWSKCILCAIGNLSLLSIFGSDLLHPQKSIFSKRF